MKASTSADMDSKISSKEILDAVMIAAPCSIGWDEMQGDERVRLCRGCDKNVYNTSEMTRDEISALLSKDGPLPCLRLYRRADGILITRDCPKGLKKVRDGWALVKRFAAAFWLTVMATPAASAQIAQKTESGPVLPPSTEDSLFDVEPTTTQEHTIDHPWRREKPPRRDQQERAEKAEFSALTEYRLAQIAVTENHPYKAEEYFKGAIVALEKAEHDIKFVREVYIAYSRFLISRHRDAAAKAILQKLKLKEKAAGIHVENPAPLGSAVGGIPFKSGVMYGAGVPMLSKPLQHGQKPAKP